MDSKNNESLSFVRLALALSSDYITLYVIDSEDDSYVEYATSGAEKELVQVSRGDNFYQSVPRNCKEQVWPEDQAAFLAAFQKEKMLAALENGRSFSLNYRLNFGGNPRYFSLKTIRADERSIVIGVRDVDEETRRALAAEKRTRTYSEIANSLASLFEIIYHVDISTGKYALYSAGLKTGTENVNFFENLKCDLLRVLHPDDRSRVTAALEPDVLLSRLHATGTLSLTYRQRTGNGTQYMNLLAFIQESDAAHLVIGIRNVDAQMRRESESLTYAQIAGSLASRYEVIYYIDTQTDSYTLYCASEQYARLGTTREGDDFFADAARDAQAYIHEDDRTEMTRQLGKTTLMRNLSLSGSVTLKYRQLLDERYQYMEMLVVQPKNDARHIVIGVSNTDARVRKEQSIRAERQTFSDIALALAHRYEVIYHVNIRTDEYTEYSTSAKYSKLNIDTHGTDFFADTQENMKHDIYPDDLQMMSAAMQKENLLESLNTLGKLYLNYRLMLDGRAQYVCLYAVRPKEDSDHIIIAVSNVDAAKRMELAYQNAVDMASRDALTGIKNKHAYVQTEAELDEQIACNASSAFAVVICDINGLKQMNDRNGHKAGDSFICKACTIICNTFKHSPVFRIGGDEFAVILRGQDYENRSALMTLLQDESERNRCDHLAILAAGISDYIPGNDMRVQDVFERADSRMYLDKSVKKQLLHEV